MACYIQVRYHLPLVVGGRAVYLDRGGFEYQDSEAHLKVIAKDVEAITPRGVFQSIDGEYIRTRHSSTGETHLL